MNSITSDKITLCLPISKTFNEEDNKKNLLMNSVTKKNVENPVSDILLKQVVAVGILNVFMDTLVGSTLVPILPNELHLTQLDQSIVLSLGSVSASFFTVFLAWLPDTYGWFSPLCFFYPLMLASITLLVIAHGRFTFYIISRLIAGFSTSLMYPCNLKMVSSLHSQHIRATAVGLTLAGDIGSLIGPTLGGYFYDKGGATLVYIFLLFICLLCFSLFFLVTVFCVHVYHEKQKVLYSIDKYLRQLNQLYEKKRFCFEPLASPSLGTFMLTIQHKINHEWSIFQNFLTLPFISRALNLFFSWGTSVVLQVTLPFYWENDLKYKVETVGLLFLPHLLFRVISCALATFLCDRYGHRLSTYITFGSFCSFLATLLLFLFPLTNVPSSIIASVILGLGLGISDACTFAWTFLFASTVPTLHASPQLHTYYSLSSDVSEEFQGRAFAIMSLMCDLGTFILPIYISFLLQYTVHAFSFLFCFSLFMHLLCIISWYQES
jgi:MFS family permease